MPFLFNYIETHRNIELVKLETWNKTVLEIFSKIISLVLMFFQYSMLVLIVMSNNCKSNKQLILTCRYFICKLLKMFSDKLVLNNFFSFQIIFSYSTKMNISLQLFSVAWQRPSARKYWLFLSKRLPKMSTFLMEHSFLMDFRKNTLSAAFAAGKILYSTVK